MKKSVTNPLRRHADDDTTAELNTIGQLKLSDIAIVEPTAPAMEVARMFVDLRIPAIAVVDAEHGLLGLITRTDVLRRLDDPEVTAEELMSCYVFSLPWDSTVECAAALMVLESVGQLVVVNDRDEVIGVVTSLDIARQVATRAGYLAA
jgi:acetoin utilization protein AcuB